MTVGVSQPGLRSQIWKCGGACHQGTGGWLWQTGCWCPGEAPHPGRALCQSLGLRSAGGFRPDSPSLGEAVHGTVLYLRCAF